MRNNLGIATLVVACLALVSSSLVANAQTNESSCSTGAVFGVGDGYNVQNNAYNLNSGAQQCIYVNSNGQNWYETSTANVSLSGAPSAYSSIYTGCHWGTCSSNQHGLPIQFTSITTSPTAWNFTPSSNGDWDIAYDIWFNPNSTTSNNSTGLELMVWPNHMGSIQPAGSVVVSNASIGGMTWNIWRSGSTENSGTISYVATSPASSFNFDLLNIYNDLVNRGYLSSNQWLIDIEAGTEIWVAGSNFTTNSFSACANCSGGGVPSAPTNLTAAAGNTQVSLSWSASSGATGYDVSRSTTNGGPYSQIASGQTSTDYTDSGLTNGTTYYYVVQACDSSGCSGNSSQAAATPTLGVSFTRASQNFASGGGSSISTSLANNEGDTLVVACRQGSDQTSISSVTDSAGNLYTAVNHSGSDGSGNNREAAVYWANNVKASSSNTVACNFASNLTKAEAIVVEEFANVGSLDASVTSTSGSNSVTSLSTGSLTTTANDDLLIYAVTTSVTESTWTAESGYAIAPNASNSQLAVEYGVAGSPGSYSGSLSWGSSAVANGVYLALTPSTGQAPAAPTGLTATASSSSQINLSWTGSSGATSYSVFSSTTNGGPYSQVASGVASTSYSNTGLTAGTTYYYVVQACNSDGCSGDSNQASATTQSGGSANCYAGSWCVKGTLPSSANYSNISEVVSAASNSTYVASVWIKGSGSVQLYVDAGSWGSTLASVQCTASSAYTQCSTPSISTGSNTQLTFVIQNSYSGAGTVYLDNTFLGVSGGSNTLANPGFESGNTGWSNSNTSTWSIGQY